MIHAVLTIDDVSSRNTPAIVDVLREKGIKAVMFATGENVQRFYQEAVYALQNGMIVGNHSYSHPAFSTLTLEEGIAEIEKCEAVLEKLYRDSGVERRFRPFRFPYGDKGGENREALQSYLRQKNFSKLDDGRIHYPWWRNHRLSPEVDTFWTFDFEEYKVQHDAAFTKESIWARMYDMNPPYGAALFGENNSHIILMHAHDETEAILPGYCRMLVEHLLENGVVFDEPTFL